MTKSLMFGRLFFLVSFSSIGFFSISFFSASAQSFMTIAETGEMVSGGQYQLGAAPQILLNQGGGANVSIFGDYLLNQSTSVRAHLGAGTQDFFTGASIKFVPFPDIGNQPAMGIRAGAFLLRDEDESSLALQVAPLVSRKVPSDYGFFTPYGALPLTFINKRAKNVNGVQFTLGSEYTQEESSPLKFGGEVAISLKDSSSYILGYVTWSFDQQGR